MLVIFLSRVKTPIRITCWSSHCRGSNSVGKIIIKKHFLQSTQNPRNIKKELKIAFNCETDKMSFDHVRKHKLIGTDVKTLHIKKSVFFSCLT